MKRKALAGLLAAGSLVVSVASVAPATAQSAKNLVEIAVHEGTQMAIALSPDRRTIVMDLQGVLFSLPVEGGQARRLTDILYDARQPCWYADGSRIAFQSSRNGQWRIWSVKPDGSDPRVLTPEASEAREPACSPDGKRIAFTSDEGGNYDIWELDLGSGARRQITKSPSSEMRPSYSPNGQEIAYMSDREQGAGIYSTSAAGVERRLVQVATDPGDITVPIGTPAWTADGKNVLYGLITGGEGRLMAGDKVVSASEDVHPFRGAWLTDDEFIYAADGKIKRRSLSTGATSTIEFTASLPISRPSYTRRSQDISSTTPQQALGILKPVISPDGNKVAFGALGRLWLMDIGQKPRPVTEEGPFVVADPAWSPDGSKLVYSSDRQGTMDLWIYDLATGSHHRLTSSQSAEMRAAWSPDGKKIAFIHSLQSWTGQAQVIDIASGKIANVSMPIFGPGYPSWSPDGKSIMLSRMHEYSKAYSYSAGAHNQAQVVAADGSGAARDLAIVPNRSIGTRTAADGPVWSPDGRHIAFLMDQALWVSRVTPAGDPIGAPRKLVDGIVSYISWTGDSSKLMYLEVDELKTIGLKDGKTRTVPLELTWNRAQPTGRLVIHAGTLVDGVTDRARSNMDIIVDDNRIVAVEPHQSGRKADKFIDASGLTVMPGLVDSHVHFAKEFGSSFGRLMLAYGVTTVRSVGNVPSDALEEREAAAAGIRPSPRIFTTGYMLEGARSYFEMSAPVANLEQAEREIQRAGKLKFDMLKTYIHTSEPVRKRLIEGAHELGIPVSSHEVYMASQLGGDSVEHFDSSAAGRGYSAKISGTHHVYDDVVQILATSQMTLTPTTVLLDPTGEVVTAADRTDPRWQIQPEWVRNEEPNSRPIPGQPLRDNVKAGLKRLHGAGVRLLIGTDTPLTPAGITIHKELENAVAAGLTPFEALTMATKNPADLLNQSGAIGSIEVGKLADLVVVEGNPLDDIRNTRNVRQVVVNGQVFDDENLLSN